MSNPSYDLRPDPGDPAAPGWTSADGGIGSLQEPGDAYSTYSSEESVPPEPQPQGQPEPSGSRTEQAAQEASNVKDTAVDAGRNVAGTAKEQAAGVAAEAGRQAKDLLHTVRSEVGGQAGTQQQRLGDAVHAFSKELGSMASGAEQPGIASDLAHQASRKGGEIAHWLQNREPSELLEDVRGFARRRPLAFLALCGLAGVAVGRIGRGVVAEKTEVDSPDPAPRRLEADAYATPALSPAVMTPDPVGYPGGPGQTPLTGDGPAEPYPNPGLDLPGGRI